MTRHALVAGLVTLERRAGPRVVAEALELLGAFTRSEREWLLGVLAQRRLARATVRQRRRSRLGWIG